MSPATQRLLSRAVLVAVLLLACGLLIWTDPLSRLESDVFSLIENRTGGEQRPQAQHITDRQGRLLVVLIEGDSAVELAEDTAEILLETGAADTAALAGESDYGALGEAVFVHRMELLFPRYIEEARREYSGNGEPFESWLADRATKRLDLAISSAEGIALGELLPYDPLLLIPDALDQFAGTGAESGQQVVLATLPGPATDAETQEKVQQALTKVRELASASGATASATGAVLFATESEQRVRAEVTRLNVFIAVTLILLYWGLIGSIRSILPVALPLVIGGVTALTATLLIAGQMHVLTLALAGILGGIALDYPMHVLLHRKPSESSYLPAIRRVLRPITIGCVSTSLVFLFLTFSHLDLIQDTGLLVGTGLIVACITAILAFAAFPGGGSARVRGLRLLEKKSPGSARVTAIVAGVLGVCAVGVFWLEWNDSIETLEVPLPEIQQQDAHVRAATGGGLNGVMVASPGITLTEALENASRLQADGLSGPLQWISSPAQAAQAREWAARSAAGFGAAFAENLDAAGYATEAFAPFFEVLQSFSESNEDAYAEALNALAQSLPPGLDQLMATTDEGAWVVHSLENSHDLRQLPDGSFLLDTRGYLSHAFRDYRMEAIRFAVWGIGIAALLVLTFCGPRKGVLILLVPGLSTLATLGILGFTGAEGNLFHVVGLLLGFGLGIDYSLFKVTSSSGMASVRMSAITTLAAFGILATSAIPAVSAVGLTVFLDVLLALVLCEVLPEYNAGPDR